MEWMTPGRRRNAGGMSVTKKAEYTQTTTWKMAKKDTVKGTKKELLGKDVDEHMINIMIV